MKKNLIKRVAFVVGASTIIVSSVFAGGVSALGASDVYGVQVEPVDTQGVIYDDYQSGQAYLTGSSVSEDTNTTKELGELIAEDPRWGGFFNYTVDLMIAKGDYNAVTNDVLYQQLVDIGVALQSYNSLFNANYQIKDILSTSIYYNGNTFNTTLSGLLAASYLYGADDVLSAVLPGIGSVSNDDVLKSLYDFKGSYIPFDPANRVTQEIEGRSMLSHAVHHASHAVSHAVSTVSHAAADAAAAAKRAAEAAAAKAAADAEAARRAAAEAARQAAEAAKRAAEEAAAIAKHIQDQIDEAKRRAEQAYDRAIDKLGNNLPPGPFRDAVKDMLKDLPSGNFNNTTDHLNGKFIDWVAGRMGLQNYKGELCVALYEGENRKSSETTGNQDEDHAFLVGQAIASYYGGSEHVAKAEEVADNVHGCEQKYGNMHLHL